MEIRKVGVIGCGLMGGGIAQVCAASGFETVVREVSRELLDKGMGRIAGFLTKDVDKGKLTAEARDAALARLAPTTALEDLAGCQLIVEAIVENLDAKREVFGALDALCPLETIFASNTSSLTIAEIAAVTRRPDRFAGLHFLVKVNSKLKTQNWSFRWLTTTSSSQRTARSPRSRSTASGCATR